MLLLAPFGRSAATTVASQVKCERQAKGYEARTFAARSRVLSRGSLHSIAVKGELAARNITPIQPGVAVLQAIPVVVVLSGVSSHL